MPSNHIYTLSVEGMECRQHIRPYYEDKYFYVYCINWFVNEILWLKATSEFNSLIIILKILLNSPQLMRVFYFSYLIPPDCQGTLLDCKRKLHNWEKTNTERTIDSNTVSIKKTILRAHMAIFRIVTGILGTTSVIFRTNTVIIYQYK